MDERKEEKDKTKSDVSASGDVGKQIASGGNIAQIGTVSGGTINIQQGGPAPAGKPGPESVEPDRSSQVGADHAQLLELRRVLVELFDESELRDLCFDLGVAYDDLPGRGKKDKARELVTYMERRQRIPELTETIERQRPNAIRD